METRIRTTGHRAGLDEGKVAHAALGLTAERGLNGWSMRDLAAELDVSPSVLYHYFPNRDAVASRVVEEVGRLVEMPDPHLSWKEWYVAVMASLRRVLLAHNGVADLLQMNRFPRSLVPLIEVGFAKLHEAGFAEMTPFAYSMICNTALGAIAGRDYRSSNERGRRVSLDDTVRELGPYAEDSPAIAELVGKFMVPLSEQDRTDGPNEMSDRYFDLIMSSILNGIELTLKGGGARA
ncbi:MAG: helix-turn-helix domain-containing protein [Berryella intestinalis]|uniref:TetR/AcrR family transcriptional regulator n=1 Tax=Berryella intestinalis TaxID=1531429 RepID=UPI002A50EE23|nr:helix-turn-helix domain-containing protein [Berryella intestinalis]MDD7368505.1 helix-turn-helix domain containing protein [Berryella intestinalis]MDY3129373.1 helix-turn-helix domain-containing protein [Berryella intestinalis]